MIKYGGNGNINLQTRKHKKIIYKDGNQFQHRRLRISRMVGVKYISSRKSINIIYSVFTGQSRYTSDTSFEKRAMKAISCIFRTF